MEFVCVAAGAGRSATSYTPISLLPSFIICIYRTETHGMGKSSFEGFAIVMQSNPLKTFS